MCFVNYGGGGYWFFDHSNWNGLTVADLVFPWYIALSLTPLFICIPNMFQPHAQSLNRGHLCMPIAIGGFKTLMQHNTTTNLTHHVLSLTKIHSMLLVPHFLCNFDNFNKVVKWKDKKLIESGMVFNSPEP